MANNIYTEVTLDVGGKNSLKVWAKQYDSNDRFITATIVNGEDTVKVDPASVVTINARREDDAQNSFVGEVNENGTVTLPITYWMTYLPGTVECDVSFYLNGRLSSLSFKLKVEEAATDPSEVIPVEDRDIVTALINDCQDAISEAESATSAALAAAQNASSAAASAESKGNAAEEAAGRASASATAADTAAGNAYAATTAANTAAARAEEAAASLEVDLTEIHADIEQNTSDISDLSGRMDTAEEDIADLEDEVELLEPKVTTAENDIRYLRNSVDELETNVERKTRMTQTVNAQSTENQYPSAKAVYDAVKGKADSSSLIPIMNALNTKENVTNKVQEITDEQGTSDYPSVPAVIDYVDEELSYVQMKGERVRVVDEESTNYTYPTSKAVYDAIQASGGASAMMVTFTITGQDASGNYTGVADKTYSEIRAALTANGIVSGQISLGTENYVSYSTMAGSNSVQFYIAAPGVIYSLSAEYSESEGTEQGATFTAYAYVIPSPSSSPKLVVQSGEVYNLTFDYKYQTSILGGSGFTIMGKLTTRAREVIILRNLTDGSSVSLSLADIFNAFSSIPNAYCSRFGSGTSTDPYGIAFELPINSALIYDLSSSSLSVLIGSGSSPLAFTDSQFILFGRLQTSTSVGLLVDYSLQYKGQSSSAITIPT